MLGAPADPEHSYKDVLLGTPPNNHDLLLQPRDTRAGKPADVTTTIFDLHSEQRRRSTTLKAALEDPVLNELYSIVPFDEDENLLEALLQDKALRERAITPTAETCPWHARAASRVKAAAMLGLLFWFTLPVSLALVWLATMWQLLTLYRRGGMSQVTAWLLGESVAPFRGTALVSGGNKTKALHVCRHLSNAGWRVVLVECGKNKACGTRFSNSVSAFYTTPIPNMDPVGYIKAIKAIAAKERVRLWVPVSMAQYSIYEALAAEVMPRGCICSTLDAASVALLNDKNKFSEFCERRGLSVPRSFPITSPQQLLDLNARPEVFKGNRFLLKSIAYHSIARADMFTLPCKEAVLRQYLKKLVISEDNPWLLQQLLDGPEYSCYSMLHQGQLAAHCDNLAELSCLNYAHLGLPEITEWAQKFASRTGMSTQLCFDFMRNTADGRLYCIECNPRTSTNLCAFYNHPDFAAAYFAPGELVASGRAPLLPLRSARPVYWLWNEVGRVFPGCFLKPEYLLQLPRQLAALWDAVCYGREAVLDPADPLPFLALHYLQIPVQLARIVIRGTPWKKLDLCSGKVVELGGD